MYKVILKMAGVPDFIVLDERTTKDSAEAHRVMWRKVLGGKNWTINRRPGIDTIDNLCLTVIHGTEED
jgi:hypothetical protein